MPPPAADARVHVLDTPRRVRYDSGPLLYEEQLVDTRYIGSYVSPIGRIEHRPRPGPRSWGQEAFQLEIDGQSLHRGWEWTSATDAPPPRDGILHHVTTLSHATRSIRVHVHTTLDGTPVLQRWLEVQNTGATPAALGRVCPWSGRLWPSPTFGAAPAPTGPYRVGYFAGNQFGAEGHFAWHALGTLPLEIGEWQGHSGWGHPLAYIQDEATGQTYILQLAWSGNWRLRIDPRGGMTTVAIGPAAPAPQRIIAPGETVTTPSVSIGCVIGDLTTAVQALHAHQRRTLRPSSSERHTCRVLFNTWSYAEAELAESGLLDQVEMAAEFGADAFVVDAGWWGNPGEDWFRQRLGTWHTASRLPNGLEPIYARARERGLLCGLWVWIEGATSDSPIIQQHPDWLVHIDGRPRERMLDLAKPDCAAWVESEIVRLIERYALDIFRIDYNEGPGEGGTNPRAGYEENALWRHYEALYAIFDRVRERYPRLILENCASGGRRSDLGMLRRFDYTQISDYFILPRAVRILSGMMLALPPEALMRMTGTVMDAYIRGDLDSQLRLTVLAGQPCLTAPAPTRIALRPAVRDRICHFVALFRDRIRPWLPTARAFHHDPELPGNEPTGWCTLELASAAADRAAVGVFRLAGPTADTRVIHPRGLAREGEYRVYRDSDQSTLRMTGDRLMETGLRIRLGAPLTSELVLIEPA